MPIPGPVVHQQLMDAYAETQSRLEAERAKILEAQQVREELNRERSEAIISLAEHYLPQLTREAIEETWREVKPDFADIFLRKEDHCRRMQRRLDELSADRRQQEAVLLETNRQLDDASSRQQAAATEVEQQLRQDSRFVELSQRAATAEAALERAEANLEEIDQESARKLPAYDRSALFRYLYDCDFGTDAYTKQGFTRRMDRALAKFIGFQKARQNYLFLKKTPEQMRAIIASDREALNTVMEELERRRDEVAEAAGLPKLIEATQSIQTRRDSLLAKLDQLRDETEAAQQEISSLEDSRGPYYREAIERFHDLLEQSGTKELKRRAKKTSDVTDDQIVARLTGVESEIKDLDKAARKHSKTMSTIREFQANVGRVIQRFRAAQFDSQRSQFVGSLDILGELDQAMERNDIDYLWKRVRRAQRWVPTALESFTSMTSKPMGQILVNAMSLAAGDSSHDHAKRAGRRWMREDLSGSDDRKRRRRK
ncbi:MAG: hypothetical protein MI861_21085 [Pirellulales bacterium]|nr:hypothetical protein [Pirellulales bacterium]